MSTEAFISMLTFAVSKQKCSFGAAVKIGCLSDEEFHYISAITFSQLSGHRGKALCNFVSHSSPILNTKDLIGDKKMQINFTRLHHNAGVYTCMVSVDSKRPRKYSYKNFENFVFISPTINASQYLWLLNIQVILLTKQHVRYMFTQNIFQYWYNREL